MHRLAIIGLGTMGAALAHNFASHGVQVAIYNRTHEVAQTLSLTNPLLIPYDTLHTLVADLESPKKIMLTLPAGAVVDQMIEQLTPLLSPGDILMDGGNSFFQDTIVRSTLLKKHGISYFGIGFSGGKQGALLGPGIMCGGDNQCYPHIQPLLETIAAKKDDIPCCTYLGQDGAGHFVKMVHNGIEYADMQLIAETYLFLREVCQMTNADVGAIFGRWNQEKSSSYLLEITAIVLQEKDPKSHEDLVRFIKDTASHKGTGAWASSQSLQLGVDISTITSALQARMVSTLEEERSILQKSLEDVSRSSLLARTMKIKHIQQAYYLGKIVAYAQGFAMLSEGAQHYHWDYNLEDVASMFRSGCIIRAQLLGLIIASYQESPHLKNLLLSPTILPLIQDSLPELRELILRGIATAIPMPTLTSALTYLDQLSAKCLGANLIQGQRDYFGAHTFQRIDKEGIFHHSWHEK